MDKLSRLHATFTAIILLLLLGAFLSIAPTETSALQHGDFTYEVNGNVATITGYTGSGGAITIPSKLGIYDATIVIGNYAFSGISSITSVNISKNVTEIGYYAFDHCSSLTTVNIGSDVESIGSGSFESCTSLTTVIIGENVTLIGSNAFALCTSLISVNIPDSVVTIHDEAFKSCISLMNATIGNGVTSINQYAFVYCQSLTSVVFGKNISYIGTQAFGHCDVLTSITIMGNISVFNDLLGSTPSVRSVIIGDGVTIIGDSVFSQCIYLTSISIPSSVIFIGNDSFSGCASLTSINVNADNQKYSSIDGILYNKVIDTLINCPNGKSGNFTVPDNVTSIESEAFDNCVLLTSVALTNNVNHIGEFAFSNCTALTSIVMGDGVTFIGRNTFYQCTSLTSVIIPSNVTTIFDNLFCGCTSLTSVVIPNNVTTIFNGAFSGCSSLTSILIPNNVTTIFNGAFSGCSSLTSFLIPNNVTEIGNSAFSYCTSLQTVIIPNNVTTIGGGAFAHCDSLSSVTLGSNVIAIGNGVFAGCGSLKVINFHGLIAPTTVGVNWIFGTDEGIIGHAYAASNFPSPDYDFNGLTMGAFLSTVPTSPTNISIISNGGNVILNWTAPADDGNGDIEYYVIYRSTTLDGIYGQVASITELIFTDNDVALSQIYWYKVSAVNNLGEGDSSEPISIDLAMVPAIPQNVLSVSNDERITLTWQAPTNADDCLITGYIIYRSTTSDGLYAQIASTAGLTYTDTGLTNDQIYWYKVSAVNSLGESPQSTAISVELTQSSGSLDNNLTLIGVVVIALVVMAAVVMAIYLHRKRK